MPLAVVTGASTGIGFHTAGQLAAKGYDVVCACRNAGRAKEVIRSLQDWYGASVSVEFRELDLASFNSVQTFASGLASRHSSLDLLVCNAGVNSASVQHEPHAQLSEDGVDVLYQTNFLSHLLLVLLLLTLLRAARGRVLSVTSVMHRSADRRDFGLVRSAREPYKSLYGLSKLAQIVSAEELHKRFGGSGGVAFHSINPGGVNSDIWRGYSDLSRFCAERVLVDAETAASTVVKAARDWRGATPSRPLYWNGYKGAGVLSVFEYWSPLAAGENLVVSKPSRDARDPELAEQVWRESIAAIRASGIDLDPDLERSGFAAQAK